jgi:predicted amidohydrolase
MRVACAQLEPGAGTVDENRAAAVEAVETAAERGADLLVLPEQFTVGFFAFDAYEAAAEPIGGETHSRLAAAARSHDIAVLAGTIVEDLDRTATTTDWAVPDGDGLANTSVLIDADGELQAVYRKAHLWGYESREAELLVAGSRLGVADIGGFTVGITTCYDLRFPELYRTLLDSGVDMLLVPSAWPFPRVEHWRTLTRARAIENLSYLVAVNGTGEMRGERLCGRSTVYDPWGTVLASAGDDPELFSADVDPARVSTVREEFPALRDRREHFDPR